MKKIQTLIVGGPEHVPEGYIKEMDIPDPYQRKRVNNARQRGLIGGYKIMRHANDTKGACYVRIEDVPKFSEVGPTGKRRAVQLPLADPNEAITLLRRIAEAQERMAATMERLAGVWEAPR